jgi:hypothetical protein
MTGVIDVGAVVVMGVVPGVDFLRRFGHRVMVVLRMIAVILGWLLHR